MRYYRSHNIISWITFALLLVACLTASLAAEDSDTAGILFLQLHIDAEGVTLVKSSVVSGTLKEPRTVVRPGVSGLVYEVESEGGAIIASGSIDNPLLRHLEYEDPDNPGRLISKLVELTEADFVLRLDYRVEISAIAFYEQADNQEASDKGPSRNLIGRVPISADAGGER